MFRKLRRVFSVRSVLSHNIKKRQNSAFEEVDKGQPCLSCGDKCLGFVPHKWRSTCASCHCGREDHDIIHDNLVTVFERLNIPIEDHAQLQRTKEKALALGYSWVPQGLSVTKIEDFMNSLPNNQIPRLHTPGEKYRDRQLIIQIPKQDVSEEFCHFLGDAATNESFTQFLELRDETAFGIGKVKDYLPQDTECFKCGGEIEAGEIGIFVDKMEEEACCWHPFCFTCNTCEELLVDTGYFFRDGQIHCERHYAESIMPRCASCDELIFTGEYVRAMDENFHSGHFCCQQCDKALSGQSYILKEEKPFCVACYDDNFANECAECNQKIGHDSKDLIFKSKHYHETCFEARYTCSMCKASLADKAFGNWDGQLCCLQCYEKNLAKNCQACGELIKPGMKRLGFQGKEWHDKCFRCKVCDKHIGGGSFVPKEDNIYCSTCYEETFGTKCAGCGKIISTGGLQYKNEPWHRECFGCAECGKSLYNTRFTVRDDKRLCADCFGERYARKCSECKQPIVGQGGTKYVCFEQRNWHNKCFNCKKCQVSLVNECFVTEGEEIICPNCAQG
ncbi:prickle planar cell polarity protein 3-B-like [Strongylocentrotus purpuratus]|uniref:Four and a half LIM domains protein 2 n=1 Tax=Strongylocentrotus purpuratus TaxID=7668 RepID=A0A7M7PGV5_STRPU|nr:prickle planar cell polarity protein 3-B-like [Strongylocentrotus purpuratus]XP_030851677.1 prickle planar cell polarity protein 3-B-like [Strongylocentrotus purpuratus]